MKQRNVETLPKVKYPLPARGLEALKHLRTVIEPVDPEHFNMEMWWCGTVGCAMGWAAQDPTFRAMGLRLEERDHGRGVMISTPVCGGLSHYFAARALFQIELGSAEHLFRPSRYYEELGDTVSISGERAKQAFLARLDKVIAEKEAAA